MRATLGVLLILAICWSSAPGRCQSREALASRGQDVAPVPMHRPLRVLDGETRRDRQGIRSPERGPLVRIAILIDVSSFSLSSAGPIARVSDENAGRVLLGEKELRISTSSPPGTEQPAYTVEIAAPSDKGSGERMRTILRSRFGHPVTLSVNQQAQRSVMRVGKFHSKEDASDLLQRLKTAGYSRAALVRATAAREAKASLMALSASGELLNRSDASFSFVSFTDLPLKVNGVAYRGLVRARMNGRQLITVINELPEEEYLFGVVPNELSPGLYPEIEALKAQAIAARTYAIRNRGKYESEGYDLTADARSQIYGGRETEHPLSSRAVSETQGLILTHQGEPIDAVYTSTCGGRTENAEFVFNHAAPYLRSVPCAPESAWLAHHELYTRRKPDTEREIALLRLSGIDLPSELHSGFLAGRPADEQVLSWTAAISQRSGRGPSETDAKIKKVAVVEPAGDLQRKAPRPEIGKWYGFAQLLADQFYPEGYADLMFTKQDIEYLLDFLDADQVPPPHRAAFAMLVRDGIVTPSNEGTLRPKAHITRRDALLTLARIASKTKMLGLESGACRAFKSGVLQVRQEKVPSRTLPVDGQAYLYRAVGTTSLPVTRLVLVGGERIQFHVNNQGAIDYLEAEINSNGLASDRFSPLSHWEQRMSRNELGATLKKNDIDVGQVVDLKVRRQGQSRRVTELDVIGTRATKTLRGSAIRSTLGLRENLFVLDRRLDDKRHVSEFIFIGRGWGHGVGLCQMGAYGLALEGANFEKILKTYYTGVELSKHY